MLFVLWANTAIKRTPITMSGVRLHHLLRSLEKFLTPEPPIRGIICDQDFLHPVERTTFEQKNLTVLDDLLGLHNAQAGRAKGLGGGIEEIGTDALGHCRARCAHG